MKINDKEFPKEELLKLLKKSKTQAIVFIRKIVNIELKEAKVIIDNLEKDPNYYDSVNKKKRAKKIVEILEMIAEVKNVENKGISTNRDRMESSPINRDKKKGSHFIKSSNPFIKGKIFWIFSLILILVYFLLKLNQ